MHSSSSSSSSRSVLANVPVQETAVPVPSVCRYAWLQVRKFHIITTAQGDLVHWQTRVHYYW
jgi:hypothetical protein